MRKIGGMFHYEPSTPIENGYFSSISSPNDDLAFTMSGRCGIYYCLQEIACHDMRKSHMCLCIPVRRSLLLLRKPDIS